MSARQFACVLILCLAGYVHAQTPAPHRRELFAGYSLLSNSLNGVSGSHQVMNGEEVAVELSPWHNLRPKFDAFAYQGSNLGAAEHPYFIMFGGQYDKKLGRETGFIEGLGGEGGVNANWGANGAIGQTASFSAILGGGLDTPLSPRFAFRVQGDFQYAYFKVAVSRGVNTGAPIYVPGLPVFFGRVTSGIVWRF